MNKNRKYGKVIVFAIMALFVGTSIFPSISGYNISNDDGNGPLPS